MNRRGLIKLITVTGFCPSAALALIPSGPAVVHSLNLEYHNRTARKIGYELQEVYVDFIERHLEQVNNSSLHQALKAECYDLMGVYLRARDIRDFKVVCDDSNNPPSAIKSLIGLDVVWQPDVGLRYFRWSVRPK